MNVMKSILVAGGATVIMAAAAQAADLPTKKSPPAPPVVNCFATFMTWLDSTPADCPLSLGPLTLYGAIDVGGGYETHAAKFNDYWMPGVNELIGKQNKGAAWQFVPNGLSQSNVGLKLKQPVYGDISVIGDVNFGFDPYSLQFANGPQSIASNNAIPAYYQSANADSSRSGGIDNSRGYAGLTSPTYGTLTLGRLYSLANTLQNLYDPNGGSYAFSPIAFSGTLGAGTGDTETARYNEAVEYVYDYNKIAHIGGIYQIGGYDQGNGAQQAYQIDVGGSYAGFSLDGLYAYDKDAVNLSPVGGVSGAFGLPKGITPSDLKATLADINAFDVLGKYQWQQWTVYAGFQEAMFSNPSDSFPGGISSTIGIPSYSVPFVNLTTTAYTIHRYLDTAWGGVKYDLNSQITLTGAYYESWQNNYSGAACVANTVPISGAPAGTAPQGTNTAANNAKKSASGNCAGTEPVVSFVVDYRPFKRVDTYAGVQYSEVTGGLANGYIKTNNTAFTAGLRVSF